MIPGQFAKEDPLMKELKQIDGLLWEDLGRGNLKFAQIKDSFRFGEEQICLVHWASSLLTAHRKAEALQRNKAIRIADPGSGSGILTILASALIPNSEGIAIELMKRPFTLLQANIRYNGLHRRFQPIHADIRKYLEDFQSTAETRVLPAIECNSYDLILANPPYFLPGHGPERDLTSEGDREIAVAREESHVSLEEYLLFCKKLLSASGSLAMLHRPERLRDCFAAMEKVGLRVSTMRAITPRVGAKPSAVLLAATKRKHTQFRWQKDLILRDENGDYLPEVASFYNEENEVTSFYNEENNG